MKIDNFLRSMICFFSLLILTNVNPNNVKADQKPLSNSPRVVDLLTNQVGTSTYSMAFAAQDIARKNNSLYQLRPIETLGGLFNYEKLAANPSLWPNTISQITYSAIMLGREGLPPVKTKETGIKYLLTFVYPSVVYVTLDPKIKTMQDLAGKKLAVHFKGGYTYGVYAPKLVTDGHGLGDKVSILNIGMKAGKAALLDGTVDVCQQSIYVDPSDPSKAEPNENLMEILETGKKVYFISPSKEAIKVTTEKTKCGIYPLIVPAGTLKFQTEDLVVATDPTGWTAHQSLSDEIAYEFVKLHLEFYSRFQEYHAFGKLYSPTYFLGVPAEMLHSGALKCYRDFAKKHPEVRESFQKSGILD